MSYILDALKKAEQERDLGRVPRLETLQDNAPRRARVLPWLVGGILLINVAALLWWLRPGAHHDATVPAPVRQASPPAVSPPRVATVAPLGAVAPLTKPPVSAAPRPPVAVPAASEPPVGTPVAPVVSVPPVEATTRVVTEPPVAKPVAPLLRDLPADFRATVPPINLDVHVYAPSAASRFVLINMKKYHEGDQLAEGPRIEEITEEGVVMNYQGQVFRIARR